MEALVSILELPPFAAFFLFRFPFIYMTTPREVLRGLGMLSSMAFCPVVFLGVNEHTIFVGK